MKKNKISMLQIPSWIVKSTELNAIDFTLICYLKYLCFMKNSTNFELSIKDIKKETGIKDNRTFKKTFELLFNMEILTCVPEFGRKDIKSIKVNLKNLKSENEFVQLPTKLIQNHLKSIGQYELRILFFLESFIIRKEQQKNYANPSIDLISKQLLISPNTVLKSLKALEDKKFIFIDRHEAISIQNKGGIYQFHKLCNNYRINFEKILSKI